MTDNIILLSHDEQQLRLERVRELMRQAGLDAMLIADFANLYYLTGRVYSGYAYIGNRDGDQMYFVKRMENLRGDGVVNIRKPEQMAESILLDTPAVLGLELDPTTFAEVKPELYARIMAKYVPSIASDANGMYANAAIDRMIGNQEWICPVQSDKLSDSAYYSPTRDTIVVPEKRQFNKGGSTEEVFTAGQRFYGTLLHEMAHSTGHKSRLNRLEKAAFGDEKYAKEELVAELSSALASQVMGFSSCLSDNNASYLNSWIEALGREPKFIVSVMADVNKASNMIFAQIDRQRIALGEEPYVSMGNEKSYSKAFEPSDASQVAKTTAVAARGYDAQLIARDADGSLIGVRPLTTGETKVWHSLDSFEEKETMTRALVGNHFSKELSECSRRMGQQQHKGMKL